MALICDKIVRLDVIYDRKGLQTSDFLRVFPSNEANSRRSLVRDTMIWKKEVFKKNFKIQKFPYFLHVEVRWTLYGQKRSRS